MATKPKGTLAQIKAGAFSRGFALARTSMAAGAKAASHAVGNIFAADEDKPERLKQLLMSQVALLSDELGQLKGSLMKVGQMLSMYGEKFLPPEANALLKSLQNQSPPLEWAAIEKQLLRQLTPEQLALVEIEHEPTASASLGQVHRARRKSDGKQLAMKIQYPGVDAAIESDLKALRSILAMSKLVPKGPKYDELFSEVRHMLHQEVDYSRELEATHEFRGLLADDPRFILPETVPELSTKRILTTSFEEGIPVDSAEVLGLSQERRNAIGAAAMELYFIELFRLGLVQTDPHFGNYRVRLGEGGAPDRLVLLDFGAVRKFPKKFLDPYYTMVRGAFTRDQALVERGAEGLGFLRPDDSPELRRDFAALCYLFNEPFHGDGPYDWGASDLPRRVASAGAQLAFGLKLRSPPREVVFLDRKMGGVFIFLSVLGVKLDGRAILESYLAEAGTAHQPS
jgi:predicted unusual protein kinase regulating ubiquinone biosynthesis (AarF/ABC1/UbiB family)